MEITWVPVEGEPLVDRIYVASAVLGNFRGKKDVEIQIFRCGFPQGEVDAVRNLGLVGPPAPDMPPQLVEGATEDAALQCILEAFTKDEIDMLSRHLQERYGEQIEKLYIAPLDLPAPLGIGPLAAIPQGENSGFINFDQATKYNLPFAFKGYYDLGEI